MLIDTAGGAGKLTVAEVGTHTTAKDLRILGTSIDAGHRRRADAGHRRHARPSTVTIDADDTLADVVTKINALERGVTASLLNDGTRQRLSIIGR